MVIDKFIINLLFPRKCCFCNRGLDFEKTFDAKCAVICTECYNQYKQIGWLTGKSRLGGREIPIDGLFALFEYKDGVKNALRQLKFAHVKENGVLFGNLLKNKLSNVLNTIDYIIPIPITRKRELERGYNQCEVIAKSMAEGIETKIRTDILYKNEKATRHSRKSGQERTEDAGKSFLINDDVDLTGKKVVVLDDILTTGSTLSAVVDLIRKKGADKIYCVVFSIKLKMIDISRNKE